MAKLGLELVSENECGQVYWNTDLLCVEIAGKRYADSAQYRAMLERALQLLKDRRAKKLLADTATMGVTMSAEDMVWTEMDWFPRCLKAGLKYFAMVMPKALGAHMTVDKFSQKFDPDSSGFLRRFFTDVTEAKEWLRKAP